MDQKITELFPEVAKSKIGQTIFYRINLLVKGLCDLTAFTNMSTIMHQLRYHPGASASQAMVFDYLADVAQKGDWRTFVMTYGELSSPGTPLSILGEEGLEEFFDPYL